MERVTASGLSLLVLVSAAVAAEAEFLKNVRQLTFDGRRSGEGYFSSDGKKLVFQSEREAGNPFYQIYLMDLETGDTTRISPGVGKTTCAWVHPDGKTILFASTHEDTAAGEKQEGEIRQRAEGTQRRYAWDYDETFELYAASGSNSGAPADRTGAQPGVRLQRLTEALGYDAEGAYSPDGKRIVFASNRDAYSRELSPDEKARLEIDKQYFCDIYVMNADGTGVRRLTDVPGYDGGPFFSADGSKICWRRFDENGERAEIWTMDADGANQRQITRLGAMSWAPFFHPSGDYLIFATNLHGFDNFELYIVDADGQRDPVRVTDTAGFDGLASFSPDGTTLAWTSNRTADKSSQIFLAEWNHEATRRAVGINGSDSPGKPAGPRHESLSPAIAPQDIQGHVNQLASERMEGRLPGTEGERLATEYAASFLKGFGLEPAGDDGTWFQPFEFTAGVELGEGNRLAVTVAPDRSVVAELDSQWRPLSFSTVGETAPAPVVFAGYGIELSDDGPEAPAYSSYFHLDVKDKWVMVLRYLPDGVPQTQRGRFIQASSLRFKAMTARQRGAKGLIVVSGPNSKVREQLVPLTFDASLAGSGLAALSITDALAQEWLAVAGKDLQQLHTELDQGQPVAGFQINGLAVSATIDLKQEKRTGRNVLARLPATATGLSASEGASPDPFVLVGAHIDHLGREFGGSSRATEEEKGLIHFGADDNASGTAGVLEVAQWMAAEKEAGRLSPKRDILFALWSGEEAGLLGSSHFVKRLAKNRKGDEGSQLDGVLAACLNMDMIGRFEKSLVLQGLGSADWWKPQIEKRNVPVGLPLTLQSDCYAPTDTTSFYPRGVPILNAFTGNHEDYHRPTDTVDKLNAEAAAKVARLMGLIARDLAVADDLPVWKEYKTSGQQGQRAAMRAYLGTVPDYSQGDEPGVKLSGVSPVGPAAKAGVRGGDVIVALGGKEILNIYDYTAILGELKVNTETEIVVKRGTEKVTLKITPTSRD
ncbi:MAG: M28 family peptidase [Verrucomicrobiales bacterium]